MGVYSVKQYLETGSKVQFLELLDNGITPRGCEHIAKALHPKNHTEIEVLKLDHNQFGWEGMVYLAEGLAVNPTLRLLSLTYCGIDMNGADYLFQILIYSRSALEEVYLSGNNLCNEGVITVLKGASIAKSLKKLALADNQFNEDDKVLSTMEVCMRKNKKLSKYDFKFNTFTDEGKCFSNQTHRGSSGGHLPIKFELTFLYKHT